MSSYSPIQWPGRKSWPFSEKILFRFIFIYFMLYLNPWTWLNRIPGTDSVFEYYYQRMDWLVHYANNNIFHTYKTLIPPNGSGDTSYAWVELQLQLLLALIGTLIWTIVDRKNSEYNRISYWFRIILRYSLILALMSYGIIKLFGMQMLFPTLSQLATPLGDLLPMRLSWLFIGYSDQYQFFSGLMEVIAALLLFFRASSAFGAVASSAVFANVVMMNLSYDIPVKQYSIHLFLMSLILVIYDYRRLLSLITNKPSAPSTIYNVEFNKRWMQIGRFFMKYIFMGYMVGTTIYQTYYRWNDFRSPKEVGPVRSGLYDVKLFTLNKDTIPPLHTDSIRWKDVVFDHGSGSVGTADTIFWQRYRRGYFRYEIDSASTEIKFTKRDVTGKTDSLFTLHFDIPDSSHLRLWGKIRSDSVYVVLKRSDRRFQLAERQFHWLSEYNR